VELWSDVREEVPARGRGYFVETVHGCLPTLRATSSKVSIQLPCLAPLSLSIISVDFVNHSPACLEAKVRRSLERHMAKAYLLARLSTVRPSKYTPISSMQAGKFR
jgi:hypothetical protein